MKLAFTFTLAILCLIFACSNPPKKWVKTNTNIAEGLHDIEAVNDQLAFSYSYGTGNLYQTTDGGKEWTKIYQFDSLFFEQIQFLNEKNAWLIGSPNQVWRTKDGGKNWVNKAPKDSVETYIYGMYFQNVQNGYIASIIRPNTHIYQTKNGGESWDLLNVIPGMILNLEKINNTLYGIGNHVVIENVDQKDGWSYTFNDTTRQVGQIRSIAQNETAQLLAASFNGYILRKVADKWQQEKITKNRIRSVLPIQGKKWIAVGDKNEENGNLFVSKDNGETWTAKTDSFPDIHRITASSKKLWMAGKEGLLMTKEK